MFDRFYGAATVGERGQIVIPAKGRKGLGLEPGAKLLAFRGPGNSLLLVSPAQVTHFLTAAMERFGQLERLAGQLGAEEETSES